LISTVVVFFIVVFFESIHVNIPVAVGRAGMGGRFPIKLLYASNIPVIFAAAFFANLQFLVLALQKTAIGKFLGIFSGNNIVGGVACYVRAPYGVLVGHGAGNICNLSIFDPILAAIIHVLVFSILFIGACILFGALWVEIGGQGPENIAEQFASSKMFIPGFRSDPRVIKGILYKYIPTITVLGSLIVGLLAVFADLAGVIGSGTGILLTVGIIYRLYEDLAKQQLLSNIGLLRRFM
jgi:preprotein translocase subunit SecY